MLQRFSFVIIICSLFTLIACSSINSALKEGDGDAEGVTKIGTPVENPVPDTGSLKAITEKFITENSKWEGAYQAGEEADSGTAYLQFDMDAMAVMIASSLADEFRSFGFEVLEDGSIKTADDQLKISFEEDKEKMAVVDSGVGYSLEMKAVADFRICGAVLSADCQDSLERFVKDAVFANAQLLTVSGSAYLTGRLNDIKKAAEKTTTEPFGKRFKDAVRSMIQF